MKAPKPQTVAICLGIFFISLFFVFPFQNLKGMIFGKIYQATRILIVADDIHPALLGWPGIRIKNVNVTLPVGDNEIEVSAETLLFRVGLKGLFPPIPAVSLSIETLKKGGDLYIKAGQKGDTTSILVEADAVNLEQINLPWLAEPIPGIINADVDFKANSADMSKNEGSVIISGKGLKTPSYMVEIPGSPFQIPGMAIGDLDIKLQTKNGALEFQTFKFGSGESDLKGSITGDVRFGKQYQQTMISLTLRMQISKRILESPQNTTFLNFLNGYQTTGPGEYAMKWNASIQEMMGIIKAIPEKVN